MTFSYRGMIFLFRLFRIKKMLGKRGADFERMLKKTKKSNAKKLSEKAVKKYSDRQFKIEERSVYQISSSKKARGAVLYLFGGGFMMSASDADFKWARTLAEEAEVDVYIPQYPLIPEASITDMLRFIEKVHLIMLEKWKAEEIRFLGFSAGASLIPFYLGFMIKKGKSERMPVKAFLSSPAWEIPPSKDTYEKMKVLEKKDPIIPPELFRSLEPYLIKGSEDESLTLPFQTSFRGLCPLYVSYGERESMLGYADLIREQARRDDFPLELEIKKEGIHCYQILTMTKEGREGQRELIRKIKEGRS